MNDILAKLRHKKEKILENESNTKNIFSRVESVDSRKIYHTVILNDIYKFGVNKESNNKFFMDIKNLKDPFLYLVQIEI